MSAAQPSRSARRAPSGVSQDFVTHAAARELELLPEATHFVVREKGRRLWIDKVASFLSKP